MPNNFIKTRESENSKLLSLLTKRHKQSTLTQGFNSNWPGKLRPSFTASVKYIGKSQLQIKRKHSQRYLRSNLIKHLSSVQASPRTLSLRPSTVGWQTQRNSAQFSKRFGTARQKFNIIKIEQNASENSFTMFKNSKISKRMSQVLSSKLLSSHNNETPLKISHKQNQQKTFKFNGQILQATKSKQTNRQKLQQKTNQSQLQLELQSSEKNKATFSVTKKQQPQYKIDFFAFNYINKVVDNPEVWMKYVHKIRKNQR